MKSQIFKEIVDAWLSKNIYNAFSSFSLSQEEQKEHKDN
jgi:hypothetical protein